MRRPEQPDILTKFVFYKSTSRYNLGHIIEGYIEMNETIGKRFWIRTGIYNEWMSYPDSYPIIPLCDWRQQQLNDILDD